MNLTGYVNRCWYMRICILINLFICWPHCTDYNLYTSQSVVCRDILGELKKLVQLLHTGRYHFSLSNMHFTCTEAHVQQKESKRRCFVQISAFRQCTKKLPYLN